MGSTEPGGARTATMQAIVQQRYGSAEALHLERVPVPHPTDDQVLVRVRAAALSRGTWHLMSGQPYAMRLVLGLRGPKQPVIGQDLAGTVAAMGPGVTELSVGDEVYGVGTGAFAEYSLAAQGHLARRPGNITVAQAASVPVSACTALQGLRDVGHVSPGQHVLVIGASGGVGTFAVQLARAFGAEVTGVCSTAKADLVRSIGADHVIDYTTTDFAGTGHRYDLILDIGGDAPLARLRTALTPRGTLVIVGGEAGRWLGLRRQLLAVALSPLVHQRLAMFVATQPATDLATLTDLIESGAVTPTIDRTFALRQTPEAMRYLESGQARGKITISI